MSEFIVPFRVGDVVEVKKGTFKGRNIIHETEIGGINDYQYTTNRGGWIPHELCVLIEQCNKDSMRELVASIEEDYDEGEE